MKGKYVAMVINGLFYEENMLIIKSRYNEFIYRYKDCISYDKVCLKLKEHGIKVEDTQIEIDEHKQ